MTKKNSDNVKQDTMIDLNKKLKTAGNQNDENAVKRLVEATDRKIDSLVYSLYGLSEGDIKIVEGE